MVFKNGQMFGKEKSKYFKIPFKNKLWFPDHNLNWKKKKKERENKKWPTYWPYGKLVF